MCYDQKIRHRNLSPMSFPFCVRHCSCKHLTANPTPNMAMLTSWGHMITWTAAGARHMHSCRHCSPDLRINLLDFLPNFTSWKTSDNPSSARKRHLSVLTNYWELFLRTLWIITWENRVMSASVDQVCSLSICRKLLANVDHFGTFLSFSREANRIFLSIFHILPGWNYRGQKGSLIKVSSCADLG